MFEKILKKCYLNSKWHVFVDLLEQEKRWIEDAFLNILGFYLCYVVKMFFNC